MTTSRKLSIFSVLALVAATVLVVHGVYAAPELSDTFTEDANTELSAHTPDSGTGWTKVIGIAGGSPSLSAANDLRITASSDKIHGSVSVAGPDDGAVYVMDDTVSSANYVVSLTYTDVDTSDDIIYVVCRYQDADNLYAMIPDATSTWRLWKKVSGIWSEISFASIVGFGTSDGDTVSLECDGSSFTAGKNGSTMSTWTDSSISSAGKAGFGMGDIGIPEHEGSDVDDQGIDNFEVTPLGGDPEPPSDTCTPPASGEQWEVDLADNCTFTTEVTHDAGLLCTGTGSFTVESGGSVQVASSTCPQKTVESGARFTNKP